MELNSEYSKYLKLLLEVGKETVNAFFPKDFEVYICSLELTKKNEEKEITTDFFVFPVMPNQISERLDLITNIKKSNSAITVLVNTTFVPTVITLNGNFGRDFKFIIGKSEVVTGPLHFNIKGFSTTLKTGYGCIKILENIINKAKSLDKNNNPYSLYFYNPALGNSYLVEPINFEQKQDLSSNMIWNYNLTFKSIAPISELKKSKSAYKGALVKTLAVSVIQKGLNTAKNSIMSNLNTGKTSLDKIVIDSFTNLVK